MTLNNMVKKFFLPKEQSIHMEYSYQGKSIDKPFFDTHPEIHHLYPAVEEVLATRNKVLENWKEGDRFTILVSEKGIEVLNGFKESSAI